MTTILKRDSKFSDCLSQEDFGYFESIELAKKSLKPTFFIECFVARDSKVNQVLIIGDTYEDCLEAYFIQKNKWSYCNGTNIFFYNKIDQENFRKYFYKGKGIQNAVKCGQDMW